MLIIDQLDGDPFILRNGAGRLLGGVLDSTLRQLHLYSVRNIVSLTYPRMFFEFILLMFSIVSQRLFETWNMYLRWIVY